MGFDKTASLRIQDARFETVDRETIRRLQFEKLKNILDKAWGTNAFYRDHWQKAGANPDQVLSFKDFTTRIPVVRKCDFMTDQEREPPFGRRVAHARTTGAPLIICTTSGTTGQGVEIHVQTRAEADIAQEVYKYLFRWAGLQPGDHVFLCFPITLLAGGRVELHGLEAYGLSVYPVGNYDVQHKLELLERFKPKAVMATTSYLGHLAAAAGRSTPALGIEVLFGGGEGGGYSWFERLAAQWQAQVFNHYGATQTRVDNMFPCERHIGTREHVGMLHNIDPYFLLEVVDPASGRQVRDGEPGEIVLTSLFHSEVPLIRCAMGDGAVYHDPGYCPCGRPFCGVEIGTIGRLDDMKKIKGINVWPQAVDDVLFNISEIDEYQIVLSSSANRADVATARLMPKHAIPPNELNAFVERVAETLRERIGVRFEVELLPVGSVARSEYKARRWIDERARG